jgi:multiple sugar transport system permease protein
MRVSALATNAIAADTLGTERPRLPVRPRRVTGGKTVSNLILIALGVIFTAPLLWLLFAAFDSKAGPTIEWPHLTFSNFTNAASSVNMNALLNSLYISTIATFVSTVPAAFMAYVFSRRHIPWKGPLLLFILMLAGVPVSILIVPLYQEFANHNWLTLVPASIFLGVTSLPFEIWIIKNFIDAVPQDLEEAARLERANTMQILRRVVVPLAFPGIAAAAIFGFINAWGNFLVPLVLISSSSQQPAPVAIYGFFGGNVIRYGWIAAYAIIYSLPVVVLYVGMSRAFRGGFVLGGAVRG